MRNVPSLRSTVGPHQRQHLATDPPTVGETYAHDQLEVHWETLTDGLKLRPFHKPAPWGRGLWEHNPRDL
jgi:hypothetical protein